MKKGFLAKTFRGIALGVGITTVACVTQKFDDGTISPPNSVSTADTPERIRILNSDVMMAKDALAILNSGQDIPADLSRHQKLLVQIVAEMRKIAVGRQMTEDAAAHGLKYALHNDLRDSAGMYLPEYNALLLSMVPYGMVSRSFVERNEEAVFNMFKDVIMSRVFHEHTHFYQHKIWNSGEAPAGVRSVDRALWYLAREAQADLNAHIAMRQYVGTQMMSGDEILSKFAFYVEKDNHDADYYSLRNKVCDDGRILDATEFTDNFGRLVGVPYNFMQGRVGDSDALYRLMFRNKMARDAAAEAGCPVPQNLPAPGAS